MSEAEKFEEVNEKANDVESNEVHEATEAVDRTELNEADVQQVAGGKKYGEQEIITAFGRACNKYEAGPNFYNKKIIAIGGTCGACCHMSYCDGWHVCAATEGHEGF